MEGMSEIGKESLVCRRSFAGRECLRGSFLIGNLFVRVLRSALPTAVDGGGGVPPCDTWTKTLTHTPCDPGMGSRPLQVQL
jgi:hypothetical protein